MLCVTAGQGVFLFEDRMMEDFTIKTCPKCRKRFYSELAPLMAACAVIHAAGGCCHYSETQVLEVEVEAFEAVLSGIRKR